MIKKLSEKIIKQIAAGEVISRPSNAVKELIENSIDAKSDEIDIIFKNYGVSSIIIKDNGIGFEKNDLKIATQIHTTSKTSEEDTMFGINSLGFRGEALASIDSVSELTIESNGYKLSNNNITNSNIKKGTKIEIKNLFQNIPARLKFIKNLPLEFKYIKEILKKYIIKYENISWNVIHNERKIWSLQKDTQEGRIKNIFKEKAVFFEEEKNNIKIHGYILKETLNTSYIYINKRPVKDKAIIKYISSIFKEYTFINENPSYILFIEMDDILIDYNVHPAKEEVKLLNYQELFSIISSALSMNLISSKLNSLDHVIIEEATPINLPAKEGNFKESRLNFSNQENAINESTEKDKFDSIVFDIAAQESKEEFKIIGQLKNSYILFESENGLGIFDQHAAAERDIYEKMKSELSNKYTQTLIEPIKLNLTEEQKIFLYDNTKLLEIKGIGIEGSKITKLPLTLKNLNFKEFFESLTPPFDIHTEIDRLVANIACKNALKANCSLSYAQMQSLLSTALKNPPICNHGRPVFKYFNNNEIKNFFKRT